MNANDLKLNRIGYIILNKLGDTSTRIREKIDLLYNANLNYESFERFKVEMEAFERFNISPMIDDAALKKSLSGFIAKFEKTLDGFIDNISNKKEKEVVNAKVKFFEFLSLMAEHKQMQDENVDIDSLMKSLENLNNIIDCTLAVNEKNPSLSEAEIAILNDSKESVKEFMDKLMAEKSNDSIESSKIRKL